MFPEVQCKNCKRTHDFKGQSRVGKDFHCKSCGKLNRIQGFDPRTGKLVCELIEDDEYRL